MYLQKVTSKTNTKKLFFVGSLEVLTKRAGSGAGSRSVNPCISKDPYPDPYQNVRDPYQNIRDPYQNVSDTFQNVTDPEHRIECFQSYSYSSFFSEPVLTISIIFCV
jgi:hypothetical protein